MAGASLISMIAAGTAAAGTAYTIYSGERAAREQDAAQKQALAAQKKQEQAADEANNRANPNRPNTDAVLSQLQQAAKGGPSGTMLTGPTGVDPNTLNLGKSTLLGS